MFQVCVTRLRSRRLMAIFMVTIFTVLLAGFGQMLYSADKPADKSPAKASAKAPLGDFKDELPRIPPHAPQDALKTMETLPGFQIEQVAAEPLVRDPVAMEWDENGRLFVVEMVDYSEQDKDFLGTIRLLEDTNSDGFYDKSTIYADKISWPTAVACYDGGIFVGAAPDIYYFKDTNGDGKADIRKTVFTGFRRNNVQGLLNSFHWGLDNRIHGATSSSGGMVRRADDEKAPAINLSGRDFSFDPKTLDLTATSGGGQHGLSFDDWGHKFVSSNSDHIQLVMFEDRYLSRNKYLATPSPRTSIAADGPQAEVFRISPIEPWRIVRTRLRVSGAVKGPVEGGGRAAGYFTGATGVTIYRGNAWPAKYHGQAFIGDVGSNIMHRKVLEPNGVGMIARRVDKGKEFVASTDIWFRPAQFANGPDGNLYIADVYREVIEHPASLPPAIKMHLDLTSGRDRGRIYRVVADGFKQPKLPHWSDAKTAELVAVLEHENGWDRDTAARLLYERQDQAAVPLLEKLSASAKLPQARMQALYVLQGLGHLTSAVVLPRLSDENLHVRKHAVRLAETVAAGSPEIRAKLLSMVNDPEIIVRYQLAFTLGEIHAPGRNAALASLARQDAGDRWVRLAIFSSLFEGAGDVLAELATDSSFRASKPGQVFIQQLASMVGTSANVHDVKVVQQLVEKLPAQDKAVASLIVRGVVEGLTKRGSPLKNLFVEGDGRAQSILKESLASARKVAGDDKRPVAQRAAAIRTLELGTYADEQETLVSLLEGRQPREVQLAALQTLSRFSQAEIAAVIVEHWPTFTPALRTAASETLFSRTEWLLPFLDAVIQGDIPTSDVEIARLRSLEKSPNAAVKKRVSELVGKLNLGRRQDVLDAYKESLTLKGDTAKGKLVFKKICSACHRLEDVGNEIGANLAAMKNRGPDAILLNVLDPNREVNPQYVNYIVATIEGKQVTGLIAAETANSVTLKRAESATDTVLRVNIEEMRSTGLSIMPEGLEKQIDKQAMADLIAYLMSVK